MSTNVHKKILAQYALIAVLGVWGLVSVGAGALNALKPLGSQDFGPIYKSARLWAYGYDPYRIYTPAQWQAACHVPPPPEELPLIGGFSTPYPPISLVNLAPISMFRWETAKTIWLAINIALAFLVPLLIKRLWYNNWSTRSTIFFTLLWFGGIALRVGLGSGQHTLLWFVCTLGALTLHKKGYSTVAGSILALSFHKAQMAVVIVGMVAARKCWRTAATTVVVGTFLLLLFLSHLRTSTGEVWQSYRFVVQWWSHRMEGGGLTGLGSSHLYPVITAIAGGGSLVARAIMFGLAAAGALTCAFMGSRRSPFGITDIEMSGILLLTLWAMYNGVYSEIVLIIPIAALYERFSKGHLSGPLSVATALCESCLIVVWFADGSKMWGLFHPNFDLSQIPTSAIYLLLDLGHRMVIFMAFPLAIYLQWRESRSGLQIIGYVEGNPTGAYWRAEHRDNSTIQP